MTWAYSSEEYGFAEQLRKEIMEPLQKRVRDPLDELTEHPFGKDKGFRASWYMAVVNHEAIRAEVKSAADGMDFFQAIVRLCNDADITSNTPRRWASRSTKTTGTGRRSGCRSKQKCGECEAVFDKNVKFEPAKTMKKSRFGPARPAAA